MYAVIFRAEVNKLDESYADTAKRLRALATSKYGCKEFIVAIEDKYEIAISHWETQEQIREWKNDPEHLIAQKMGKSKWYHSTHVQIVNIIREYSDLYMPKNDCSEC